MALELWHGPYVMLTLHINERLLEHTGDGCAPRDQACRGR